MYKSVNILFYGVDGDVLEGIGGVEWKTTIQGFEFWWNYCHRSRRLGPRDKQWLEGMNRYISNAPV